MARYKLDTGNAGNDEILVGDSVAEVTQDVLNRYEVDELPAGWTIEVIDDSNAASEITRQLLDAGKIVHAGWTPNRDTADQCGVNVLDYFDASGKFLGADENGVEPIFETA